MSALSDFIAGITAGQRGEPIPRGASGIFRRAHAKGVAARTEQEHWDSRAVTA